MPDLTRAAIRAHEIDATGAEHAGLFALTLRSASWPRLTGASFPRLDQLELSVGSAGGDPAPVLAGDFAPALCELRLGGEGVGPIAGELPRAPLVRRLERLAISADSEGAGVGALVLLPRVASGPSSAEEAAFPLAGIWRLIATQGWIDSTRAPGAEVPLEDKHCTASCRCSPATTARSLGACEGVAAVLEPGAFERELALILVDDRRTPGRTDQDASRRASGAARRGAHSDEHVSDVRGQRRRCVFDVRSPGGASERSSCRALGMPGATQRHRSRKKSP